MNYYTHRQGVAPLSKWPLLFLLFFLFFLNTVNAQTPPVRQWNGSISSNWNVAANWTPAIVPTSADSVVIKSLYPIDPIDPVIPSGVVAQARCIYHDAFFTNFTIESGGTLELTGALNIYTFTLEGPMYNYGTINVKSGFSGIFAKNKFNNYGTINLGSATATPFSFKEEGLHIDGSLAQFNNYSSGIINIFRPGNNGILITDFDNKLTNYGTINIDRTGLNPAIAATGDGIDVQDGIFTNETTGKVYIKRSGANGFNTQVTGETINKGYIEITEPGQSSSLIEREGILNEAKFTNTETGHLKIDLTTNSALYNKGGVFENSGKIEIGTSQVQSIRNIGLANSSFTGLSKFTNKPGGNIVIKNTDSIGVFLGGIGTTTVFENQAGASISIDRSGKDGFYVYANAAFENRGTVDIGMTSPCGRYGYVNIGQTLNQPSGVINLKHSTSHSIVNERIVGIDFIFSFINAGQVNIDNLYNAGGQAILNRTGATFKNQECSALLKINSNHNIQNAGDFTNTGTLVEKASSNSSISQNDGLIQNLNGGTFSINTNSGAVVTLDAPIWRGCADTDWSNADNWHLKAVPTATQTPVVVKASNNPVIAAGNTVNVLAVTVLSQGNLTVASGATLNLSGATANRMDNQGTVTNQGTILVQATNGVNTGIKNSGTVTNAACAVMRVSAKVENTGTLTNAGLLSMATVSLHSNTGTAVNNGIVEYLINSFIPNLTNNDLIIRGVAGSCTLLNALEIGGSNNFTAATTWYKDANLTIPAGTYNQASNIFTSTNLVPGSNTLYFSVNSPDNCPRVVSWMVNFNDAIPPTITCPANTTVALGANCTAPLGAYALATKSDNCTLSAVETQSPVASTLISGHNTTQTVTLSTSDISGNTSTCQFTVTAKDITAPTITCPANTTVSLMAFCRANLGSYALLTKSDNCAANIAETQSPAANTELVNHNATQTVVLTANDGNGNTATCQFTVTAKDIIAPSINCPGNTTVALGANCTTPLGAYALQGKADNCGLGAVETQSPASGTVISGHNTTQTVTLSTSDINGNTASCQFIVTAKDIAAPAITCPANTTVAVGANCTASLGSYVLLNKSDNCATNITEVQSPAASTVLSGHNATQTVVLTANDGNGNTATCQFTVTAKDIAAPAITCPANTTVAVGANCTATLGSYALLSKLDNCAANITETQSPAASTVLNGHNATQTVVLTANDGNGNTATCQFTVTAKDITAPAITCPANTTVAAGANCTATVGTRTLLSKSDNCAANIPETQSPAASTVLNGHNTTQTITLTATDGNDNSSSCQFTITVKDVIAPTVVCKPKVEATLSNTGQATIFPANAVSSSADNCGVVNLASITPNSFTCGNLGITTAILTVNDGNGNTATCSTIVSVVDYIAPTMVCRPVTLNLNANGQAVLTPAQVNNGSVDNCTLSNLTLNQTQFSCAQVGNNVVTLTGTDQSGNTSQCTAVITLRDLIAPVAKCKNATANLGANGTLVLNPSLLNNLSTDNCSITFTALPATFGCANVGNNIVTLRATDGGGNSSTCTAILTVKDASAPTALCKPATVFLNNAGVGTLTVSQVDNGSTDACGISTRTLSQTAFNCSEVQSSPWPVFLTVKDVNGNSATCTAMVTVKDAIAPTAFCENTTVNLGANGLATVYPADLAGESVDNCAVWSYSPVAKVYTAASLGNNNLTITVKDWSGNAATCVSVVTVLPYNGSMSNGTAAERTDAETAEVAAHLYPNPNAGRATLAFELPQDQEYTVRVVDMQGREVWNYQGTGLKGDNTLPLDLFRVPSGVYSVILQSPDVRVVKMMVRSEE